MAKIITTSMLVFILLWAGQEGSAQGNFWEPVGDSTTRYVPSLGVNKGDTLYAGAGDSDPVMSGGGLFCSTDHGDSWRKLTLDAEGGFVGRIFINSRGHILTQCEAPPTSMPYMKRSTDHGAHWTSLTMWALLLAIDDSDQVFAGGVELPGVARSTDNGETWDTLGSGLPVDTYGRPSGVSAFAFHPKGDAWAASYAGGLYYSSDHGTTWHSTGSGLGGYTINLLTLSPTGDLYASGWSSRGVLRSTDKGINWMQRYSFSPGARPILCTANGDVFAGTAEGVFKNGESVNTGLTCLIVRSIVMDSRGYLFAGTYGGGIFRSTQAVTAIGEACPSIASEFALAQNYPNPFNPSTTIKYELPKSAMVRLSVHDILGHEVSVLVNERKNAGAYDVTFDATGLATGVYFYRLQAGSFADVKKLLFVR